MALRCHVPAPFQGESTPPHHCIRAWRKSGSSTLKGSAVRAAVLRQETTCSTIGDFALLRQPRSLARAPGSRGDASWPGRAAPPRRVAQRAAKQCQPLSAGVAERFLKLSGMG